MLCWFESVLLDDGITICSNCWRLLATLVVDCAAADWDDCPGVGGFIDVGVGGDCPGTLLGVLGGAGEEAGLEGRGDWRLGGMGELLGIGLGCLGDICGEGWGNEDLYMGLLPPDGICGIPGWGPVDGMDVICPGCPGGML